MRFLAIGRHSAAYSTADAEALMPAEMSTASELYREQFIREGYMDVSYTEAVLLIDADDPATVTDQLNRYPLVKGGLIQFEITRLVGLPAITVANQASHPPAWWPADPV